MKLTHHVVISLAVSAGTYALSRSAAMTAASFLAGIFIDLDHLFDYVREYGFRWDIRFFFHCFEKTLFRRVVIFLHSWELVIILAGICAASHGNAVVTGTLIGMGQHLISDQLSNRITLKGYWFFYRLRNKFVTVDIFPFLR